MNGRLSAMKRPSPSTRVTPTGTFSIKVDSTSVCCANRACASLTAARFGHVDTGRDPATARQRHAADLDDVAVSARALVGLRLGVHGAGDDPAHRCLDVAAVGVIAVLGHVADA